MAIGKKILSVVTVSVVLITALSFYSRVTHHPGLTVATPEQVEPIPSNKLNINTATVAQLDELPGIGPTLANAIVSYREENGPFQKIGDLMLVKGIGKGRLEKIADLITVGG